MTDEKLIAIYVFLTLASETLARSVLIHLQSIMHDKHADRYE